MIQVITIITILTSSFLPFSLLFQWCGVGARFTWIMWYAQKCIATLFWWSLALNLQEKCKLRHPPGNEIYRKGSVSFFEIDGRKNKVCVLFLSLSLGTELWHWTVKREISFSNSHFLMFGGSSILWLECTKCNE